MHSILAGRHDSFTGLANPSLTSPSGRPGGWLACAADGAGFTNVGDERTQSPVHRQRGYSRAKIACEDLLVAAFRDDGFPATIVRPSHTYDKTKMPLVGGWTALRRRAPRSSRGRPASALASCTSRPASQGGTGLRRRY